MSQVPGRLITYCTNIHPGESWIETFSALREHLPRIKAAVAPDALFPVGLRLSAGAAVGLSHSGIEPFASWLSEQGCFVPTLNGFPFGDFHGGQIKENVYLPDWRSIKRVNYTKHLADLLARLLPNGIAGSISTVPLAFKGPALTWNDPLFRKHLLEVLVHLDEIRQSTGKTIILALEPEPGCLLETTAEVCRFFRDMEFPAELTGLIGICYDCCHQAVEFEDPAASLKALDAAGIAIAKVQASSALRFFDPAQEAVAVFADPHYLHQIAVRHTDGKIVRYADLPQALSRHRHFPGDEWRCHFHLPIFLEEAIGLGTTRFFLEEIVPLLPPDLLLEVETYTWQVLPPELRREDMSSSIAREILWLEALTDAPHRRS